jgi:hypothetical protein
MEYANQLEHELVREERRPLARSAGGGKVTLLTSY